MTNPIKIKSKLAANPTNEPLFSVELKLQDAEVKAADPRAIRGLIALMDMQAQIGGAASHFGGPSAFAEMMSSLHAIMFHRSKNQNKPWYELFNFVNDAGHCENGLYALKALYGFADLNFQSLKGFRSIDSVLTGHGESHLFPEGVLVSNGPLGSGLPQAQGLAIADALSETPRVTVAAISDGGCMEGEARESLAAIPGLAANGKMAPFVLMISDNNTKLSGRIDKDAFSMQPTFASLKELGWNVIEVEHGHDLQQCAEEIETALDAAVTDPQRPVALWVKTIKGYGTKNTAASSSGAHGFPLKKATELPAFIEEIYQGESFPDEFQAWIDELVALQEEKAKASSGSSAPSQKVQVGISAAMIAARKAGHPIVSVSSDLPGSTGVAGFQKEFPDDTVDVGVAEANMISTAIGLSKSGYIPVVDTFSQFGVTKGSLPLLMSALSQGPLIAVFSHAGFQDAADGASHQALSYLAMTCSLPHTDVYVLTSSDEAEALMTQTINNFAALREKNVTPRSTIFFLGRENFPHNYLPKDYNYKLGEAQVVFDNVEKFDKSVAIVAAGPLLHQALEAAYELEKKDIGTYVINPSIINKPDVLTIASCLRNTKGKLLTVEDHQKMGGIGSLLSHELAMAGIPFSLKSLAVNGVFGQSAYEALELYKMHGLDSSSIISAAEELAKK